MMFLDTIKLTFNNLNLIWKVLLYHVICLIIVCGLTVAVCYPLIIHLSNVGFFSDVLNGVQSSVFNFQIDQILTAFIDIFEKFVDVVSSDFATYLPYAIVAFCVVFFLGEFLFGLAEIPTKECLYGYMGSWSRLGFVGCFIKNLGRSIKFSLARLLVVLPFDLLMLAAIGALLYVFSLGTVWSMFVPFFIVLTLALFLTLKQMFFGGWACAIIALNKRTFEGLKNGFGAYLKAFGKVFSVAISIVIIVIAINVFAVMFTASVGVVLTLPLSLLCVYTFCMVAYFYTNGLKFYIDKNNIVSPRKIEDFESINVLKERVKALRLQSRQCSHQL